MLPINFNNTLPHSFGSSWKNLPPNFFGKKDESKQMRKGEGGADLRQAPKGMCSPLSLIIATSLGLMKVQGTKVMDEENQTFFHT